MLKKITNLAFLLAFTSSVFAAPIDKQSALLKAQTFVKEKGYALNLTENRMLKAPANAGASDQPYYIFNSADEQGFVIVAGDDLVAPILGYSDKGSIDPDNIPDGLAALLDSYRQLVEELRYNEANGTLQLDESAGMRKAMTLTKNPVKPFLTTYFGHYAPYYNFNPTYDGKTPSGCACATVALAEVMAHYKYPEKLPKAYGYTTETLEIELPDLPGYTVDWNNILPNYTDFDYDQTQCDEIARFINHLGQALHSDFQEDSSSPSNYVYTVLKNYGYRSSSITQMTSKLLPVWEDTFYDDLIHGRPVIASGRNITVSGARHVFIFDGYDQDGYYHVDWGWNGCAQGYYNFSHLSPYKNVATYSYYRDTWFVYNVEPKTYDQQVRTQSEHANLDLTSLTLSGGKIVTKRTNYSGYSGTFLQGLGLVDEYNKMLKVLAWDSITLKNSSEVTSKTWTINDLSGIKDGTYRVFAISQLVNGDSIWHYDKVRSTYGHVKAVVKGGSATFSLVPTIAYHSFEPDNSLSFLKGAARTFTLNLTNNTMDLVNRKLYFFEDSINIAEYANVMVPAGATMDYDFTYIPQETGEHVLWLCTDTLRSNILYEKNVNVKEGVKYTLKVDSIIIDNYDESKKYLYGNELRVRFKLTNSGPSDYNDYFRILLKKSSWYDTVKPLIHLKKGQSQWFEFDSKDLAYYQTFSLFIYYKTSSSGDANIISTYTYNRNFVPRPAVRMWKTDGKMYAQEAKTTTLTIPEDVLALDLTAPNINQPSKIVPNTNPNTLYYVTAPYPELDGFNQIIDGQADSITLTDGIPCYVPMDFKANNARYTRTFEKGFMGRRNQNNWTTLALPFDVDKVYNTVDGTEVTWYQPGQEDGDFWLREFYGEDGFYTYFTDAEQLRANVPYIITVPGSYVGEEACLVGKPLVFSGDNTQVVSKKVVADARNYDFQGSYFEASTYGKFIYVLDEEDRGNNFIYTEGESTVQPFRGYFTSMVQPQRNSKLYVMSYIKKHTTPTAVKQVEELAAADQMQRSTLKGVYTITGRKVAADTDASAREILNTLPKGVYIINGKKYMK
ncbi:MAG: C10 family peptidase [Prevotella sp.]|nr:C10 family peptidase [Prevotella sp.]